MTQDQQALSVDEKVEFDGSAADNKAIAADQTNIDTTSASLGSDKAKKAKNCAEKGGSTAACTQDAQTVGQDHTQLTQARQQLATTESTAVLDEDQNEGKVGADRIKLQGDQATLALLQATAVNPGTTYTSLPKVGQISKQDQPVYSVSNEGVPLLYGSIAAYRAFYVGMSDGADVGELTHDLIALGYAAGLAQSNHYSPATATATEVERRQRALGLPATGEIVLGEVVFEPGPIRVTSVTPSVGTSVGGGGGAGSSSGGGGGGTVLTATGTTRSSPSSWM